MTFRDIYGQVIYLTASFCLLLLQSKHYWLRTVPSWRLMLVKLKMENMKHSIVHKNNILAHPDHSSWAGRFPVTDKKSVQQEAGTRVWISTNWPERNGGGQSFSDGMDRQRMSTRAVAITCSLLISPTVWKKEMSTVFPNRVQFSATEIGLFWGKDKHTDKKRQKAISQCIIVQNHCILHNFL